LCNPNFEQSTLNLRGGIEFDDYGKPLAYHVLKNPTWSGLEIWYLTLTAGGLFANRGIVEWERIPAETDWGRKRVLHIFSKDRVDQSRGKPVLTPIIEQFRMLDSYQRTELQSAIVNSLVAGVIETPMDPAGIAELMGGDPNAYLASKGEYRPQMEGGTFIPLYPGDKLTPYTPNRPPNTYPAFVESISRQIGAALGLPYELVYKDFSKTNYSSARAALNEAWRFFLARRQWLGTYWASPVYKLWLEEVVNAGLIEAPDFYELMPLYLKCKWLGPGRGYTDAVKEANAAQIRMTNMISTLEMECAEQGLDWVEVLDQRALELERMRQLNLMPAPMAGTPPQEKPDEEEEEDDEEEEETPDEESDDVDDDEDDESKEEEDA
jgi:lambda family phage portal protein